MLKNALDLPVWVYVVGGGLVLAGVVVYGQIRYHNGKVEGRAEVQTKWNTAVERGKAEIARLEAEAGKVTVVTEVKYVEQVRTIREKGDTIIKQVEVFVPAPTSDKPSMFDGGFRLFHDAAATNTVPNPAEIPNATPVAANTVAATVGENYTRCHVAYATVAAWQQWAAEQCKLNDKGCPDG